MCANYNWDHRHPHVPQISLFFGKVQVLVFLFAFFDFHSVVRWDGKIHKTTRSLFFIFIFYFVNHHKVLSSDLD